MSWSTRARVGPASATAARFVLPPLHAVSATNATAMPAVIKPLVTKPLRPLN